MLEEVLVWFDVLCPEQNDDTKSASHLELIRSMPFSCLPTWFHVVLTQVLPPVMTSLINVEWRKEEGLFRHVSQFQLETKEYRTNLSQNKHGAKLEIKKNGSQTGKRNSWNKIIRNSKIEILYNKEKQQFDDRLMRITQQIARSTTSPHTNHRQVNLIRRKMPSGNDSTLGLLRVCWWRHCSRS